jgi:gamma-glutamylcyclotransferase (GGCT)/AIG2-like uncharacterized protein YtfP
MGRPATALEAQMRPVPLFVYGTLRDFNLRKAVLGYTLGQGSVIPARLPGFRVVHLPGRTYPGLLLAKDETTSGALLQDLTEADRKRLDAYEGSEYRLDHVTVECEGNSIAAAVYQTLAPLPLHAKPWSLEEWQQRHKAVTLAGLEPPDHDGVDT